MGNIQACCDAKAQLENSGILNGARLGEGTNPEKIKNFSPPIQSPEITSLINKAETSQYFIKPNAKSNNCETIIYGNQTNAALYDGQTEDNIPNGYGKVCFQNGEVFEGTFEKGEPTNGIFVFNQTCYYVGYIKNFQASGMGVYENIENGYYYEGQWKKNLQNGKGIEKYSNTDVYEGGFMFGSKFGEGTYKFSDGRVYEGSFYNGHSDGNGKMSLPNGDIYEGEWKLGTMHGKGVYKWKNGEKYDGQYENGVRQGHGVYYYQDGFRYEGNWLNGVQEGQGSIFQGYDEVKGVWQSGIRLEQE